jgi:hypothetical protein
MPRLSKTGYFLSVSFAIAGLSLFKGLAVAGKRKFCHRPLPSPAPPADFTGGRWAVAQLSQRKRGLKGRRTK